MEYSNKPYVWVNNAGIPDMRELHICVSCITGKKIELFSESEDSERLIIEYHIEDGSNEDEIIYPLYGSGTIYIPSKHKKVTIKILQGDVLKGMSTVMPTDTFFS